MDVLMQALKRLPGVGPKTAQRMAFHLLERDRSGALEISVALKQAVEAVLHCERCNNFSEELRCLICTSSKRDASVLCIVETPADLDSIEEAGVYQGMYFVLMGHLSPIDGIGPEELGIDRLTKLLESEDIAEVILATNLTVEGEATADFLGDLVGSRSISVSRLARGVPVGGELEYMDQGTLRQAFEGRRLLHSI
ncbi:MAG: recombination mediator RecR [Arenicellales bacterium]|nr:recombination mediator RecR [Arenicellales bacterium]MDP6724215.1 recombination mediator RecR [Arenicellales bacterium]HJL66331.1 recombination mediator RecR [Arenicellales bacterium]